MAVIDEGQAALLDSLDIPRDYVPESLLVHSPEKLIRMSDRLITPSLAKKMWVVWSPAHPEKIADEDFAEAFRKMLASGVALGFKLGRFKENSKKLPDSGTDAKQWMACFEQALNQCEIRVVLNGQDKARIEGKDWEESLNKMVDGLFYELGLNFPPIQVDTDPDLEPGFYKIEWNDLKLPPLKSIGQDQVLVNDTVDRLILLNLKGQEAVNPANGSECALIPLEFKEIAEQAGLTTWDEFGYLTLALSAKIRKNAGAFVNETFLDLLLYQLNQAFPTTVELIEEKVEKYLLIQVIRGLLAEEISIRNLQSILDTMLSIQSNFTGIDLSKYIVFNISGNAVLSQDLENASPNDYVSVIRNSLKRQISHKYTRGQKTLIVYLMDPKAESRLQQPIELSPDERSELIQATHDEVGSLPPTAQNPVILTTMEVRLRLKTELQAEIPHLAVLSYQELSPDMNIQPIARISPKLYPVNIEIYNLVKIIGMLNLPDQPVDIREDELSPDQRSLRTWIHDHREAILQNAFKIIHEKHKQTGIFEEELKIFISQLFKGWVQQLFTAEDSLVDQLHQNLFEHCAIDEIRISDIFNLFFCVHMSFGVTYQEANGEQKGREAIFKFNHLLEKSELAVQRMALRFLVQVYPTEEV